jgi:hypothetical protein
VKQLKVLIRLDFYQLNILGAFSEMKKYICKMTLHFFLKKKKKKKSVIIIYIINGRFLYNFVDFICNGGFSTFLKVWYEWGGP